MDSVELGNELEENKIPQKPDKVNKILNAVRKKKFKTIMAAFMMVAVSTSAVGCAAVGSEFTQEQINQKNTYKSLMEERKKVVKYEEGRIKNAIESETDQDKKAILEKRLKQLKAEEENLSNELNESNNNPHYAFGGTYIYTGGYGSSSNTGITPRSSYSSYEKYNGKVSIVSESAGSASSKGTGIASKSTFSRRGYSSAKFSGSSTIKSGGYSGKAGGHSS